MNWLSKLQDLPKACDAVWRDQPPHHPGDPGWTYRSNRSGGDAIGVVSGCATLGALSFVPTLVITGLVWLFARPSLLNLAAIAGGVWLCQITLLIVALAKGRRQ